MVGRRRQAHNLGRIFHYHTFTHHTATFHTSATTTHCHPHRNPTKVTSQYSQAINGVVGGRCPREAGSSVSDPPEIAFLKSSMLVLGFVLPFSCCWSSDLSISPQTEQIMDHVPRGPILEFYQFHRLPTYVPDCFPWRCIQWSSPMGNVLTCCRILDAQAHVAHKSEQMVSIWTAWSSLAHHHSRVSTQVNIRCFSRHRLLTYPLLLSLAAAC